MVEPYSPSDLSKNLSKNYPEFVLKAVNELLASKYRGSKITLKQNEVVDKILLYAPDGYDRHRIFDEKLLDFEKVYEMRGWDVKYDKPAYNETYEAFYIFKASE